jgi:hypothetical protein
MCYRDTLGAHDLRGWKVLFFSIWVIHSFFTLWSNFFLLFHRGYLHETQSTQRQMSRTCHILIRPWDKHSFLITTFFLKVDEIICFSSMKSPFCQWKGLVMRNSSQLVLPSLLIMSHNRLLRPPATRYSLNTPLLWLYRIASVLFLVTWSFANVRIVTLVVVKLTDRLHPRFIVHSM